MDEQANGHPDERTRIDLTPDDEPTQGFSAVNTGTGSGPVSPGVRDDPQTLSPDPWTGKQPARPDAGRPEPDQPSPDLPMPGQESGYQPYGLWTPPAEPAAGYPPPSGTPDYSFASADPSPQWHGAPARSAAVQTPPGSRRGGVRVGAVIGLVALAGVLGGGAGAAVTTALAPAPVASSPAGGTQPTNPTTTVTKVVQSAGSAPDWSATAAAVTPSVVAIQVTTAQGGSGQGSGVILDTAGHVVTNNHVVNLAGQARIRVMIGDTAYNASVVGLDPTTDLAVIKIDTPPKDLQPITLADSSKVIVGEPTMAVGNPLGLSGTVTTGIVSAVNRPVTTQESGSQGNDNSSGVVVTNAIQTSAPINPGNSGGALVNANGELIGINSSIASLSSGSSSQSGSIGIGFAIPSNQVKYITDQLIAKGVAEHAFLGVSARDSQSTDTGKAILGAEITQVVPGTPAAEAGLQVGDLIVSVDGAQTASSEAMVGKIRDSRVGQEITVVVLRDGQQKSVKVTLAAK